MRDAMEPAEKKIGGSYLRETPGRASFNAAYPTPTTIPIFMKTLAVLLEESSFPTSPFPLRRVATEIPQVHKLWFYGELFAAIRGAFDSPRGTLQESCHFAYVGLEVELGISSAILGPPIAPS